MVRIIDIAIDYGSVGSKEEGRRTLNSTLFVDHMLFYRTLLCIC